MENYEQTYEEFWKEIIENENGEINKDQLMRELHDYRIMIREVKKVYDHVTGGKVSNPMTISSVVCMVADDHYFDEYATINE